jgi:hypothetical protein
MRRVHGMTNDQWRMVATGSQSFGLGRFPTEDELNANLWRDTTPDQVVALFGKPPEERTEKCISCYFR